MQLDPSAVATKCGEMMTDPDWAVHQQVYHTGGTATATKT